MITAGLEGGGWVDKGTEEEEEEELKKGTC